MDYSLATSVAPTTEPLTLAETRLHLRVDDDLTDQDALISGLIKAAREWTENYCRRSWCDRTLVLRMDGFPDCFLLPRGPVRSVTSITYLDASGASQTLAASQYQVDIYSTPPRIVAPLGVVWPNTQDGAINAVSVTYAVGYGTGGSPDDLTVVPASVKAAMKLLIGHWYENRELVANVQMAEVPMAVKALLSAYEIRDYGLE